MNATSETKSRTIRQTETPLHVTDPARYQAIRRGELPMLLDLAEAGAALLMSVRTVRENIRTRQLSAVRTRGRVLVRREAIAQFLDRHEVKAI